MIKLTNLHKSFGQQVLFEDLDYIFPKGDRIALVGSNGAGKTTLIDIISGITKADHGDVEIPKNARIGYLPQNPNPSPMQTVLEECEAGNEELYQLKKQMQNAIETLEKDHSSVNEYEKIESAYKLKGGYSLAANAAAILNGLGFGDELLHKSPKELSGGWRMRLELARLFIKNPDFLILDEPTNHLDLPSLVWVENWLQNFSGTLLFVSHDRALLNRLATSTLHLANKKLTPYAGNFDYFLEMRELKQSQLRDTASNLQKKREHMEKFVERFGAKATKASQANSRKKMIERIRSLESNLDIEGDELTLALNIPEPKKCPRILLEIKDLTIGYDKQLAKNVDLQMEKNMKIAIIGANGIGKTTLLKTLVSQIPQISGEYSFHQDVTFSYFAQDQLERLKLNESILNNMLDNHNLTEKEARSILGAFMFRDDDIHKNVGVLSGGETSRLGLAKTLTVQSSLLLLDEPTNHLDMTSVEILASSLNEYTGSILFVSHDRNFIDTVCTHVFVMLEDGRNQLFEGNLADYQRMAKVSGFPNIFEIKTNAPESTKATTQEPKGNFQQRKEQQRRKEKLQREIKASEKAQEQLRKQIQANELAMSNTDPSNYAEINRLATETDELKSKLEELELEWLELSDELESTDGN